MPKINKIFYNALKVLKLFFWSVALAFVAAFVSKIFFAIISMRGFPLEVSFEVWVVFLVSFGFVLFLVMIVNWLERVFR